MARTTIFTTLMGIAAVAVAQMAIIKKKDCTNARSKLH
jgi:hypothetical protein